MPEVSGSSDHCDHALEVHGWLIAAPWSALIVRGDANLDPEDE